jgi:ABC-type nitrate/sulfonate/bicarbonate transport system permease component
MALKKEWTSVSGEDAMAVRASASSSLTRPVRFFAPPWEAVVALLALAACWEVASHFAPPYAVPGWERIGKAVLGLPLESVLITLARVMVALALSFIGGMIVSIVMYSVKPAERFGMPIIKLLMAVPVVCWILFAVLWFKWAEFRIAFVLVVVCCPVFIVDFLDGMKGVSKDLRDMTWSFRPTRVQFFAKLIIPATLPTIFTSWKINLSLAIRVVTMAELVGATSGVGYGLVVAQEVFSVADVFAWTMVLVACLFLTEALIALLEKHFLRWRI